MLSPTSCCFLFEGCAGPSRYILIFWISGLIEISWSSDIVVDTLPLTKAVKPAVPELSSQLINKQSCIFSVKIDTQTVMPSDNYRSCQRFPIVILSPPSCCFMFALLWYLDYLKFWVKYLDLLALKLNLLLVAVSPILHVAPIPDHVTCVFCFCSYFLYDLGPFLPIIS